MKREKGTTYILQKTSTTPTIHYTHPIENPVQLLSGVAGVPTTELAFHGGGENAGDVTLRLLSTADYQITSTISPAGRDVFRTLNDNNPMLRIGNMTLDGLDSDNALTTDRAVNIDKANDCAIGGLVVRDMNSAGIEVAQVSTGLRVSNNTISGCPTGILISEVLDNETFLYDGKRGFRVSCVENNIVLNYSVAGISIGTESPGSTDPAVIRRKKCMVWNPFSDTTLTDEATPSATTPNYLVPVRNNWVHGGSSASAFLGADWYSSASGYGLVDENNRARQYGERFDDPGLGGDLKLTDTSAARGAGSPYRIDARKLSDGKWWGMRRSLGAHQSPKTADYDIPLE